MGLHDMAAIAWSRLSMCLALPPSSVMRSIIAANVSTGAAPWPNASDVSNVAGGCQPDCIAV